MLSVVVAGPVLLHCCCALLGLSLHGVRCSMPVVCWLCVVCLLVFNVCGLLCVLFVVRCDGWLVCFVCSLSFADCCVLVVVCCLLSTVCLLLCVACCCVSMVVCWILSCCVLLGLLVVVGVS